MKPFSQILIGITIFSLSLYNYLQSLNELTQLRMELPQAQQQYLYMTLEYQQLQDELHSHFNLKSMKQNLESPTFCHLRHYEHPEKSFYFVPKNLSDSKVAP